MLGHRRPAGSRHKGHGGGNVEAVGAIAAGAAGVHQGEGRARSWHRTGLPQHRSHRRQLATCDPLGPQRHQQAAGEHGVNLLIKPALHEGRGLLARERISLQQLLQESGPGMGLGHGDRGRKGP